MDLWKPAGPPKPLLEQWVMLQRLTTSLSFPPLSASEFFLDCSSEVPAALCRKCSSLTMGLGCGSEWRRQSNEIY